MFKVGDEVVRIGGNGIPCKVIGYDEATNYLWLQPLDLLLKYKPFTEHADLFKLRELEVGDVVKIRDVKASWRICGFDETSGNPRFAWLCRLPGAFEPPRRNEYVSIEICELTRVATQRSNIEKQSESNSGTKGNQGAVSEYHPPKRSCICR